MSVTDVWRLQGVAVIVMIHATCGAQEGRRGGGEEGGGETVNCSKYEPHTSCICVLTWHGAAAWRIGVLRMSVSIRVIFNLI